jgi:chromosome segregation ATPase
VTTESRISFLEGALTQVSERLRDHTERFTAIARDIQSLRSELRANRTEMHANVESLRSEMNANDETLRSEINALRAEMNANDETLRTEINSLRVEMNTNVESLRADNAAIRREYRWIGGIVVSGIIAAFIANLAVQIF